MLEIEKDFDKHAYGSFQRNIAGTKVFLKDYFIRELKNLGVDDWSLVKIACYFQITRGMRSFGRKSFVIFNGVDYKQLRILDPVLSRVICKLFTYIVTRDEKYMQKWIAGTILVHRFKPAEVTLEILDEPPSIS